MGTIAIDGTKLWANAAQRATLSEGQLEAELGVLEREVEELLERAEPAASQGEVEGPTLPR